MSVSLFVTGAGAVLPGGVASGVEAVDKLRDLLTPTPDGSALSDFDPKGALHTVKGYLDGAGKYALGAAALALDSRTEEANEDGTTTGVVSATRWGATDSGFRFLQQLVQKGPRLASPLIFPHSYANAAGNLVAMEWRFSGPHMVYLGEEAAQEALNFAAANLRRSRASRMLLVAYEAAAPLALPDGIHPTNGAIALLLSVCSDGAFATIRVPSASHAAWDADHGATAALVQGLNAARGSGSRCPWLESTGQVSTVFLDPAHPKAANP